MTPKQYGEISYFIGRKRNPEKDKLFCKKHIDGKDFEYQTYAFLEWFRGYDAMVNQFENDY